MNQLLKSLLFGVLVLGSACCTAVKGYAGPEKSDAELSWIWFSSEKDVSINSMQVDETSVSVFKPGVKVLPGNHQLKINVNVKYIHCLYSVGGFCPELSTTRRCALNVDTTAGKTYKVRVQSSGSSASVTVTDDTDDTETANKAGAEQAGLETAKNEGVVGYASCEAGSLFGF